MCKLVGGYEIEEGLAHMDFSRVHELLKDAYWCRGIAQSKVERAAKGSSLVMGAFLNGQQIAYARVVSDLATFGWISDVIVDPAHQGKGLGRALVKYALEHPLHQGFRRWVLKTRDAQGVYEACGFKLVEEPGQWMDFRPSDAPPTEE